MPLARIITNAVDESLELTMQLRARGFRVETVAPGKIPTSPADLEVRLDECAPEEIVARAADADPNDNLWVFVAPGALDERARPMRVRSLVPQTRVAPFVEVTRVSEPARAMATEAALFPSPEDDPILAELESDGILCEQDAAQLHEITSQISNFEMNASLEPASASDPIKTGSELKPLSEEAKSDSGAITAKTQAVAIPANSGSFSIPQVPDRPPLKAVPKSEGRPKARPAVYKITFQTGPSFWRAAWVSAALVVLVGVLAVILETNRHLPANIARPAAVQLSPSFPTPAAPGTRLHDPELNFQRESNSALNGNASASDVVAHAAQVSSAKTPKSSRHNAVHADDIIAEDTVVFYDRRHRSGSSKIAAQAQSGKYSDQD